MVLCVSYWVHIHTQLGTNFRKSTLVLAITVKPLHRQNTFFCYILKWVLPLAWPPLWKWNFATGSTNRGVSEEHLKAAWQRQPALRKVKKWKPPLHRQLSSSSFPPHRGVVLQSCCGRRWAGPQGFTKTFHRRSWASFRGSSGYNWDSKISFSASKQRCLFKRCSSVAVDKALLQTYCHYNKLVVTEWLIQPRPALVLTAWRSWKLTWGLRKVSCSQQK